jgi:hypothetical protein
MMDIADGKATPIYANTYEPIIPEWVSSDGTEAIIEAEPPGGGDDRNLEWVSPTVPLP